MNLSIMNYSITLSLVVVSLCWSFPAGSGIVDKNLYVPLPCDDISSAFNYAKFYHIASQSSHDLFFGLPESKGRREINLLYYSSDHDDSEGGVQAK